MKAIGVEKKMTKAHVEKLVNNAEISKSQKIRELFDGGLDVKEIATHLNIRYNFAYNILQNHINKNGIAIEKAVRVGGVSNDHVLELLSTGMSLADVSRETKMNYNQVWKLAKEHGMTKKQQAVAQ